MDKSMILELAMNGNYFEEIKIMDNKEYMKNYNEHYSLCEKLCENLDEKQKREMLNKIFMAESGMLVLTADEYFKAGFKLGLVVGAQNFLD